LRQRIDIVNAGRAKAFSRLTVLFCTPDRLSGRDVIILNSDAIQRVCDEVMVANSELFALVHEYNRIARTCVIDDLRITHLSYIHIWIITFYCKKFLLTVFFICISAPG
ncbi:hypothetical protein, partial [Escherichia coli]|uniref:hypothetical protein n=1 Tax=Escherichia coli TaxID=562 RepID=UPI002025CB49